MKRFLNEKKGFTLIELLLVVIVLGILAALAIPQFTDASKDTKESTLKQDLGMVRDTIERYYHQHGNTYPGAKNSTTGAAVTTAAEAATAFGDQLTKLSNSSGVTTNDFSLRSTYPYGPYLKTGVPVNPLPASGDPVATVKADITTTTTVTADGTTGWMFAIKTGQLIANNTSYSSW